MITKQYTAQQLLNKYGIDNLFAIQEFLDENNLFKNHGKVTIQRTQYDPRKGWIYSLISEFYC